MDLLRLVVIDLLFSQVLDNSQLLAIIVDDKKEFKIKEILDEKYIK